MTLTPKIVTLQHLQRATKIVNFKTALALAVSGTALMTSFSLQAQTKDFTGAVNNSWSVSGNWTPSGAPGPSNDVTMSNPSVNTAFIDVATVEINDFNFAGTKSMNIVPNAGVDVTVNFTVSGNLDVSVNNNLTFRNGTSDNKNINLILNTVTVSDGKLLFGGSGSSYISGVSANSFTMTGGEIWFNGNYDMNTGATLSMAGSSRLLITGQSSTTAYNATLGVKGLSSASSSASVRVNTSPTTVAHVGTLRLNNEANTTFSYAGDLINTGLSTLNVVMEGEGTQIFTGASNTYIGTTTVNNGTLLINNTAGSGTGTGAVTVNNGGRFGGTGFSGSSITVADGGSLLGGDGLAASDDLSLSGNVAFQTGSLIEIALGASGAKSSLTRTGGTWSFDAAQEFLFVNLGAEAGTYDNIISGLTGSESGLGSIGTWTVVNSGWSGTFNYDGAGGIDFTLAAVPEPSAYAFVLAGGCLYIAVRRRKSVASA